MLHKGRSGLLHVRVLAIDDDGVDVLLELLEEGFDERLRSKVIRYVLSRVRDVARDSFLLLLTYSLTHFYLLTHLLRAPSD